MHILDKIAFHKQKELTLNKALYSIKFLERLASFEMPTLSLKTYLLKPNKSGIIAEFKRKSPTNNSLNLYGNLREITVGYMQSKASALSILTDSLYFGGSLKDLASARQFNYCPILRKDFIIDTYQILEAKAYGADAILLIAELLSKDQIKNLTLFAQSLNLEVVLEIHCIDHISKIHESIDIIGVNNRNLKTFKTNLQTSILLSSELNQDFTCISESGITSINEIEILKKHGYKGFLIGSHFMKHSKPNIACNELSNQILEL